MIEIRFRDGRKTQLEDERAEKLIQLKERGVKAVKINGEEHLLADVFIGRKTKMSHLLHMGRATILDAPIRESHPEAVLRARRYFQTKDKRYHDYAISLQILEEEHGQKWNGL